ncbi:Protein transport protein BOS1 [Cyberlindnera jadinii]|uniref:Protein transport protein BOS1 n=1 Tax=Cyberlindnera jadinii (strain ATCC 18201 / CBS 1600 / BCRC 20928 / JCM 3617 / NBRC 0987 / NRRL Y-1542) TaxID=983966 RepID=A0A0H5BYT7_CYBJN|nr:Protein transport protein BOS1 [Cyberlindnera jadinii]
MNAIHNHAVRQIATIRKDLTKFEEDVASAPLALQGSIAAGLTQLTRTIDEYEGFVKQETDDDKKVKVELKLSKFRTDCAEMKRKLQELKRSREEMTQALNRSALLNRRPQANDNPYGVQQDQQQQQQAPSLGYAEGLHKETDILARGNAQLDDILEMGREAFDELVSSNRTIQQIGQKLTGTLGTLGVSQETIRLVERRAKEDKFVFWGCLIVFFVLCYYFYKWFG